MRALFSVLSCIGSMAYSKLWSADLKPFLLHGKSKKSIVKTYIIKDTDWVQISQKQYSQDNLGVKVYKNEVEVKNEDFRVCWTPKWGVKSVPGKAGVRAKQGSLSPQNRSHLPWKSTRGQPLLQSLPVQEKEKETEWIWMMGQRKESAATSYEDLA